MATRHKPSKGWLELVEAGWHPILAARQPRRVTRWYVATPPDNHWLAGLTCILLRQQEGIWHLWCGNFAQSGSLPWVDCIEDVTPQTSRRQRQRYTELLATCLVRREAQSHRYLASEIEAARIAVAKRRWLTR